jgi:hypothetical protein
MKREKNSYARTKLDHHLNKEVLQRNDDFDILSWWKVQGKYSVLQSIAMYLLAIVVSIIVSECAFSTSNRLLNLHHSKLIQRPLKH